MAMTEWKRWLLLHSALVSMEIRQRHMNEEAEQMLTSSFDSMTVAQVIHIVSFCIIMAAS